MEARFLFYKLKPGLTLCRITEYQRRFGYSPFKTANHLEVTLQRVIQELEDHAHSEEFEIGDTEKIITKLGRCLFRRRCFGGKCGHDDNECPLRQYWFLIAEKPEDVS